MAKQTYKLCARSYWSKNLTFQNTTLRIPLVSQPLTNSSNQIKFNNACPICKSKLKRVDYCPKCSQELRGSLTNNLDEQQLSEIFKIVSSNEVVKIHTIGEENIVFSKEELETIKTETSDILAIGYGDILTINPQHIENCYALLPNLNEFNDDGDYRRLLMALIKSKRYLVVQYSDRGNTKQGVIIGYKDSVTNKTFLMLVNTKECKDLNTAIEYQPNLVENETETQQVIDFIGTALPNKNFNDVTENLIEKKKQMLVALKLSGQPIPLEHKEQPKPQVNGFAMATQQLQQQEQKQIEVENE